MLAIRLMYICACTYIGDGEIYVVGAVEEGMLFYWLFCKAFSGSKSGDILK